jgi:hypothetical protein
MAQWKKVVVSGSAAELASLTLTTQLGVAYGGTGLTAASASGIPIGSNSTTYTTIGVNGSGQVVRTTGAIGVIISGSFSGSFQGDGSQLTGVGAGSTTIQGPDATSATWTFASEALKFNTASNHGFSFTIGDAGSVITVQLTTPQDLRTTAGPTFSKVIASTSMTASTMQLTGIVGGSTNTVLTIDGSQNITSRSIDSRVWGSTLIDGAGSNTRLAYFSDTDTLTSAAGLTYDGTNVTIGTSTFGTNVVVAGDLTVNGDVVSLNVTNINVEDRFILLNSGSATGDGGIIIQSGSSFTGAAFGWDASAYRWGYQQETKLGTTATALAPEAYAVMVIDVDGGQTELEAFRKNGNIRVSGSDVYIYV